MSRYVEVCFLPVELEESWLAERTAIVVDLLRASTTIAHALFNGARDVIPVESPEKARDLRDSIGRDAALLCGERRGIKIDGFDLGNSPFEYAATVVRGKTLVFASSNGSGALLAARSAERLAVAALNNLGPVVHWTAKHSESCLIVCAGKLGRFSAEDAACAGLIVSRLRDIGFEPANDAAHTALGLCQEVATDWSAFLGGTDHGRYLLELGFADDIALSAEVDTLSIVPVWHNNRIAADPAGGD